MDLIGASLKLTYYVAPGAPTGFGTDATAKLIPGWDSNLVYDGAFLPDAHLVGDPDSVPPPAVIQTPSPAVTGFAFIGTALLLPFLILLWKRRKEDDHVERKHLKGTVARLDGSLGNFGLDEGTHHK
jgi:hypothetical protein